MMKALKILLCTLLVVGVCIGVCSCGDGEAVLDAFKTAITETAPKTVEGEITVYTDFGPLEATYTTVIADDGSLKIDYTYEKFNLSTEGGENDTKSEVKGTVTRDASGTYSATDSSLAAKITVDSNSVSLNLDEEKMTYTVQGNVLSAKVLAADTESVLGVAYDVDVNLVVAMNSSGAIVSYTLDYTPETGRVTVVCNFK